MPRKKSRLKPVVGRRAGSAGAERSEAEADAALRGRPGRRDLTPIAIPVSMLVQKAPLVPSWKPYWRALHDTSGTRCQSGRDR